MNFELEKTCNDFLDYSEICHTWSRFSDRRLDALGAYICLMRRCEPTEELLQLCRDIVHEYSGFFSMMRGFGEHALVAQLSCERDPGAAMALTDRAYHVLRDEFSASHYLPMLAYYMATSMAPDNFVPFARRVRELYEKFNDKHPWLTGERDVIFTGLLVGTGKDPQALEEEAEYTWQMLLDGFRFHKDAIQTLAHALTLCKGEAPYKVAKFRNLRNRLRSLDFKYGKDYEIVPLGILANSGIDEEQIVADFAEVNDYLKGHGNYGFWLGFSTETRYLHTILCLSAYYQSATNELAMAYLISVLVDIEREQSQSTTTAATM